MMRRLRMLVPMLAALISAMPCLSPALARSGNAKAVLASNRGFDLYQKGDYQRAMTAFNEAIRIDPKSGLAWGNRGSVWFKLGKYDECVADITQAIGLGHNDPVVILNRGTCYFLKGDYEKALEDCNAIIRTAPRNAVAYRTCGVAYEKKGEREKAFASFDEALRLNPLDAKAYNNRGAAYQRIGENRKALADLAEALRLKPDFGKDTDYVAARQAAKDGLAVVAAVKPVVPTPPVPAASALSGPIAETRVALVIGNSAYEAVGRLDNPPRDAAAVADSLRAAGFRIVHFDSDLTAEAMRRALNAFSAEAATADWALVYYAGHGIEAGGVNYLVPVDAKLKTDRSVQFEAVPLDAVLASIEGAKKLRLVILDACRDNPFLPGMARTVATRSVGRGLARVEPETGGTLVAYAAKAGQVAMDGAAGQANSPFASALIRNMGKPGIEIRKFFGLVRDEVLAETEQTQEPFVYGSLGGDDYFFRVPAPAIVGPEAGSGTAR